MRHEFKRIEPKWQKRWEEAGIFKAVDNDDSRPKFYGLGRIPLSKRRRHACGTD